MAYGQGNGQGGRQFNSSNSNMGNGQSKYKGQPRTSNQPQDKVDDNVAIAYLRTSAKGEPYFNIIFKKEIADGTKLVMFENKFSDKSEKSPTHILRVSKPLNTEAK